MFKGLIVDIQRFSLHDGPGIRSVIFFKGCPLNCLWCQNPEAIDPKPQLAYRQEKCIKCGTCSDLCPENAIKGTPQKFKEIKCKISEGCTLCMNQCPSKALEIAGKTFSVDELMKYILKDNDYYEDSSGGITCSGGEPTYQWMFVKKFLTSCKDNGISTAIETCGFFNPIIIDKIFELSDIILFDIKHLDESIHKILTGKSNKKILENLKNLNTLYSKHDNKELIVRLPLIPTLNDSIEHLFKVEEFISNLNINKLTLLPYQSLYIQKIDRFRLNREKLSIKPYEKFMLEKIKKKFKKVDISIGG